MRHAAPDSQRDAGHHPRGRKSPTIFAEALSIAAAAPQGQALPVPVWTRHFAFDYISNWEDEMAATVVLLDSVRRQCRDAGKPRLPTKLCEDVEEGQFLLAQQLACVREVEASAKALQASMRRSTVLSTEAKGLCARLRVLLGRQ